VGAPADASILAAVEGPVEPVDARNNKRTGKKHLTRRRGGGRRIRAANRSPFGVR